MMELTDKGRAAVEEAAARHGVSEAAARAVLASLALSGGGQAQFSHPELGGMGQWSRGGMVMVGDMFNNALKARVDALCTELSDLLGSGGDLFRRPPEAGGGFRWWPDELGRPAAIGSQNQSSYAWFPDTGRLAILENGRVRIHDTGDHRIAGVSQQQSSGRSLAFQSQHGTVRAEDFPLAAAPASGPSGSGEAPRPDSRPASAAAAPSTDPTPTESGAPARPDAPASPPSPGPAAPVAPPAAPPHASDPIAMLERLADLRAKGILSEDEFAAKKADLLSRI